MAKVIEEADFQPGKQTARELLDFARAMGGTDDPLQVVALAVQLLAQVAYEGDPQAGKILSGLAVGMGAVMAKSEVQNGGQLLTTLLLPLSLTAYRQGAAALGHTHGQVGHG